MSVSVIEIYHVDFRDLGYIFLFIQSGGIGTVMWYLLKTYIYLSNQRKSGESITNFNRLCPGAHPGGKSWQLFIEQGYAELNP